MAPSETALFLVNLNLRLKRQPLNREVRTHGFQDEQYSVLGDWANIVIHLKANHWRRIPQRGRHAFMRKKHEYRENKTRELDLQRSSQGIV